MSSDKNDKRLIRDLRDALDALVENPRGVTVGRLLELRERAARRLGEKTQYETKP